jgi:hypothetical protein
VDGDLKDKKGINLQGTDLGPLPGLREKAMEGWMLSHALSPS